MAELDPKEIERLAHLYKAGKLTPEEKEKFERWYTSHDDSEFVFSDKKVKERILRNLLTEIEGEQVRRIRRWPLIAAAATILIAFGIGVLILRPKAPKQTEQSAEMRLPAKNGVTLKLGNGQTIALVAQHGNVQLANNLTAQQKGDSLAYQPAASAETNTLNNNSGHRYTLSLSDGTEVNLDVASSITYPVAFNGPKRQVSMTGQAYFKVHHDAAHPFSVITGSTTIQDIGTEFNVNTFDGTQTTLIQGSIKVNNQFLQPGEMTNGITITPANTNEVTAWLQDKISYKNATLEHIMNEVARVYQVKIVWQDNELRQRPFIVKLNRSTPLANILNYFRMASNIDFKVDDKTVTIFKKPKN